MRSSTSLGTAKEARLSCISPSCCSEYYRLYDCGELEQVQLPEIHLTKRVRLTREQCFLVSPY